MAKEKATKTAAKAADKAIGAAAFDIENPQSDPDSGLTQKQTRDLYEKLRKERQRVLEGVRRHIAEATDPTGPMADEMDQASRDAEQAYLIRYANKERKLLIENCGPDGCVLKFLGPLTMPLETAAAASLQ